MPGVCRFVHTAAVDCPRRAPDHVAMGEYAVITAAVASLAISIATMPEGQLAARLPTTAAKAQALVANDARAHGVSGAEAKAVLVRAPYQRAPLRYLYVSGWLDARKDQASCIFAKASAGSSTAEARTALRRNKTLVERLARMHVTVAQAAGAVVRGAADAC